LLLVIVMVVEWRLDIVRSPTGAKLATAAGDTWMILCAVIVLLQASVKVQDSVMSPPQYPAGFCVLNVDAASAMAPTQSDFLLGP
jgi:hypothetical protein